MDEYRALVLVGELRQDQAIMHLGASLSGIDV